MKHMAASPNHLGQTGQNLIRVLIASYFIAVSIGLISGTTATVLMLALVPPGMAEASASVLVFVLSFLVLMGIWLRPAALLLGMIIFSASYIDNLLPGNPPAIADFWRDLALIGALMLTYVQTGARAQRGRAMIRWTPRVRRVSSAGAVAPRRVAAGPAAGVPRLVPLSEKPADTAPGPYILRNPKFAPTLNSAFRDEVRRSRLSRAAS
ncbi:MAG: hypothetical protein ACC634_12170 [Hyphomicrobiales bacterium]